MSNGTTVQLNDVYTDLQINIPHLEVQFDLDGDIGVEAYGSGKITIFSDEGNGSITTSATFDWTLEVLDSENHGDKDLSPWLPGGEHEDEVILHFTCATYHA